MEFLEIIQNCLQIFGILIRFLDFSIRFLFEISPKVYEIFSNDTPLKTIFIYSAVSVIFSCYKLENRQSHMHSLCNVMSYVV